VVVDGLWFSAQDKYSVSFGAIGAHRSVAAFREGAMFGLRRFRFRSPERNRESAERRLGHIQGAVRTAIAEAEAESKGLRLRVARTRSSVVSLQAQVEGRETDQACRAELSNLEHALLTGERSLAQLEDHLTALRKLERRLDRLINQAYVAAVRVP
jgi:chromosome segregation ATPase